MGDLINYIKPELLIVALVLYFIGVILKKIKKIKDNYIPIILGALGIATCIVYLGFVGGWTLAGVSSGVVQGVLCAAASTYVNQVIKQMVKLGKVDEETAEVIDKVVDKTKEIK